MKPASAKKEKRSGAAAKAAPGIFGRLTGWLGSALFSSTNGDGESMGTEGTETQRAEMSVSSSSKTPGAKKRKRTEEPAEDDTAAAPAPRTGDKPPKSAKKSAIKSVKKAYEPADEVDMKVAAPEEDFEEKAPKTGEKAPKSSKKSAMKSGKKTSDTAARGPEEAEDEEAPPAAAPEPEIIRTAAKSEKKSKAEATPAPAPPTGTKDKKARTGTSKKAAATVEEEEEQTAVKAAAEPIEEHDSPTNEPSAVAAAEGDGASAATIKAATVAAGAGAAPSTKSSASAVAKELRPEKLAAFEAAEKRKGVVYMSRVPPFMKPHRVKQLLEPYGDIGRIYLAPEDPAAQKRRVAAGGNKKAMFTEGWIEFLSKKDAKFVAATLNNQPMGGNKRGFYASDLWLLKYLKGFKWHHLTEKIAYENRIRAQKLRAELAAAKKEAEGYIEKAELSKALDAKQAGYVERERKRKARRDEEEGEGDEEESSRPRPTKRARKDDDEDEAPAAAGGLSGLPSNIKRTFKQTQPLQDKLMLQAAKLKKERAAAGGSGE